MAASSVTPKPSRYIVAEWVVNAFDGFPEHLIKNAWTKTGYVWFDRKHIEFEDEDEDLADDDDEDLVLRMDWSMDWSSSEQSDESDGTTDESDGGNNLFGMV